MVDLNKTFDGASKAKITKKGVFLTEGQYVLKVKLTTVIQPMSGPEAFILESEVVESSDPENHPVGTERTWYQGFKYRDSALGEIKKFAYAALNLDLSNPTDQKKIKEHVDPTMDALLKNMVDTQSFKEKIVRCEVVNRPNKSGDGSYAAYNFSPARTTS